MELISKLGIDWKLLIAQIVNFFILLVILYKFVYKPVLTVLEKRSKRIEEGIKNAETAEKKLKDIEKLQEEKITAAERKVGQLIEEARKDAEGLRQKILEEAAGQAEDLIRRARLQLEEEKEKMINEVRREVTSIIVQATSRMLQREFSDNDQKRLFEAINKEISTL